MHLSAEALLLRHPRPACADAKPVRQHVRTWTMNMPSCDARMRFRPVRVTVPCVGLRVVAHLA